MIIVDLAEQFGTASVTTVSALTGAWLAWRIWRRLLRAVIACAVVGLVIYLVFPGAVAQFVHDRHPPVTSDTGVR